MTNLNNHKRSKRNRLKGVIDKFRQCYKRSPSPMHHASSHQPEPPRKSSVLQNGAEAGEACNQDPGADELDTTSFPPSQSMVNGPSTPAAPVSSKQSHTDESHEQRRLSQSAISIWNAAFADTKNDEEMKQLIAKYESQLRRVIAQDEVTETKTEEAWGPGQMKEYLQGIGETLKDAGRHEKAKSNTLAILTFVKGLDSFVSKMLSECPPAALAWAGICAAIPIVAAPMEQDQKMVKGLKHICDRAPTYFSLPDNLLQHNSHGSKAAGTKQPLQITIQTLYRHILEYVILSICFIHRRRFRRIWEALSGQTEWESRLTDINNVEKHINMSASIFQGFEQISITEEIQKSLKEASNRAEAIERRNFLHSLKGTDYKERLDATNERLEGTCEWFCQHEKFRKWLDASGGLLLVSADAGCGKSVLSKYLIEEVLPEENPGATICYFFFKDDDKQARSFSNASKALLHRLLQSNETLTNDCMKQLGTDIDHTSGLRQVWSAFAQVSTNPEAGPTICVLDALDESDPTERRSFIDCLKKYYTEIGRTRQVKFLITTRGYPQIVNSFQGLLSSKIHLDGNNDEEKGQIQQEISIVMEERLKDLIDKRGDISPNAQLVIRRGLTQKGSKQRTYLWMHLMFEILERTYPRTHDGWEKLFRELPSDISKAYERLLDSVEPDAQEEVHNLLALIIASERPLTLREHMTAVRARETILEPRSFEIYTELGEDDEFKTWCSRQCGSFISFHGRYVHLIHQTAREFLQQSTTGQKPQHQDASIAWQGSLPRIDCHRYMAESCISLLSLDKFRSSDFNREIQHQRHNTGADDAGNDNRYYFLKYSAKYWLFHFEKCQAQTSSGDVTDIGTKFVPAYRSLFTNKDRKPQKTHGEKRQAWYYLMMDAQPQGWFPPHYPVAHSVRRLFPNAYNVARTACLFGHLRLLKLSKEELGADFDHKAHDSVTRFTSSDIDPRFSLAHFAAYGGSDLCLRYLKSQGCDMNIVDSSRQTPLHQAAGRGLVSTVETLIEIGATAAALDDMRRTPFMCAIMKGIESSDLTKLRKCLGRADDDGHATLNEMYGPEVRLLLRIAVRSIPDGLWGRSQYIKKNLIWNKANNLLKEYEQSPINALIEHGVDINQPIHRGMTALHLTLKRADLIYNTVFLLLKGANKEAVDRHGQTPLQIAAKAGNDMGLKILQDPASF